MRFGDTQLDLFSQPLRYSMDALLKGIEMGDISVAWESGSYSA